MYPLCFTLPYTYWRIRQIFKCDYDLDLVAVVSYKGSRYSPKKYNLVRPDGTIQLANVTLDVLRQYLAAEGYPLKDE